MRYRTALDGLNFFLADVRGGLGPYVSVFLLTQAHWNQATIGAVQNAVRKLDGALLEKTLSDREQQRLAQLLRKLLVSLEPQRCAAATPAAARRGAARLVLDA